MAYFDGLDDQQLSPEAEAESRRRMLGMLASGGRPSVLGQPARVQPAQPGTREYDLSVNATNQPTVPPTRLTPMEAPKVGPTAAMFGNKPPALGTPPILPGRPNVMPTREDFPTKPVPTWQKVLGIAAAPFLPNLTTNILGRPQREQEQQYRGAVQDWNRGQESQVRQAQLANIASEIKTRENPPPKDRPENLQGEYADAVRDAMNRGVDPAQDPKVKQIAGAITALQKPPTSNETQEDQRYEGIRTSQRLNRPVSPEDAAWSKSYEQRKTLAPFATAVAQAPQKGTERSDKSFQFNNTALDKVASPVDQITQRMGRLTDTLNQNSPQADALVAPELLSVMSGGQGSGLRMNEAEIARIVGGRSNWESLKASINKWKLDPNAALSITPDQRAQIRALTKTVQDKLTAKQKIIDDARDALINADDPKDHRRIVADSKKKLDAIDAGGGGTIRYVEGNDQYDIPPEKEAAFNRAHPNAKRQ